jgi:predicted DNA-binding transcriptional regulator AlpA
MPKGQGRDKMKQRLNTQEAAEYVGVTKRMLQDLRTSGGGPRFMKLSSKTIRYDLIDIDIWIERKKRRSTVDKEEPDKSRRLEAAADWRRAREVL